ncbi:hypothetical protein A3860_05150 [Niastella vici]|uniref:Uncharacterized protein n=1 Tax=Niastella vici TaxID=1703345 RepID=A0A1V9FS35_9BACT|nr:hypothetical protein [Niastella vici]OQP61107.1 hypothetical protein A3860_05150 [Niastella vici]
MKKNYKSIEDLIVDESFIAWYFKKDETQIINWNKWIAACEGNRDLANKAASFLNAILLEERLSNEAKMRSEENLMRNLKKK